MAINRTDIQIIPDTGNLALDSREGMTLLSDTDYTALKSAPASGTVDISIVIPIHNECEALDVLIPALMRCRCCTQKKLESCQRRRRCEEPICISIIEPFTHQATSADRLC